MWCRTDRVRLFKIHNVARMGIDRFKPIPFAYFNSLFFLIFYRFLLSISLCGAGLTGSGCSRSTMLQGWGLTGSNPFLACLFFLITVSMVYWKDLNFFLAA
ncbi:hypothetical protein DFH28DRAFT_629496 [Melampsora americana]|nr:hypothetical protein DFH28DRAFT_629496 [Melampsora americana]